MESSLQSVAADGDGLAREISTSFMVDLGVRECGTCGLGVGAGFINMLLSAYSDALVSVSSGCGIVPGISRIKGPCTSCDSTAAYRTRHWRSQPFKFHAATTTCTLKL